MFHYQDTAWQMHHSFNKNWSKITNYSVLRLIMNTGSVELVMITSLVMCKASGIRVGLQTSASYIKTVRQRYRYSHVWPQAKGLVCIYGSISISRSDTSVCPSVCLCALLLAHRRLPFTKPSKWSTPLWKLFQQYSACSGHVYPSRTHTHTHTHTCTVALEYSATSTEIRQSVSCQKFNKSLDLAEWTLRVAVINPLNTELNPICQ